MGIWSISGERMEGNTMPVNDVAEVCSRRNRKYLSAILETGFTVAEAVKSLPAISVKSKSLKLAGDCPVQNVHPRVDAGMKQNSVMSLSKVKKGEKHNYEDMHIQYFVLISAGNVCL